MANFVVKHSLHDGTFVGECNPINLEHTYKIDDSTAISYEIPKNIGLCDPKYTQPYYTDWTLYRNGIPLAAGSHTPVETTDNPGDTLKVAGLGWTHIGLEKRFYPFDPANPTAHYYAVIQRNAFVVVKEIIENTLAEDYSLDGVTFGEGFDYLATDAPLINYQIEPGDTTDMLTRVRDLSQLVPFDFDMTWDKVLNLYYPQRGSNTQRLQIPKNLLNLQYTNNGIAGNYLLATGASATSQLGVLLSNTDCASSLRRMDTTKEFGNITDIINLSAQAAIELNTACEALLPLQASVFVNAIPDFWDTVRVGDSVPLLVNIGYTLVNAYFRIVQITGRQDNNANEIADLSFNIA